jgi:small subunit ribosomal protein S4
MSRYTGPSWKKSRRLGFSTLESGKDLGGKKKSGVYSIPGQHGGPNAKKGKQTEYGKQLAEKQKVRIMYGLNERQCIRFFLKARKNKGVTGYQFLVLLESRLDNLVYRLAFSPTRRGARQLVNHGHILVNGAKVDIPSYICKPNDVISVKEGHDLTIIKASVELRKLDVKKFLELSPEKLSGKYLAYPDRTEIAQGIQENLIVEFYNRNI